MYSKYFRTVCAGTAILMAVLACNAVNIPNVGGQVAPTNTAGQPAASATSAATTSIPTEEAPSETPTPAISPTITLTLEPSLTATLEVPMGQVLNETNCRTGPGTIYDLVVTYQAKDQVQIVARDLGGGYVYVQTADKPDQACWLLQTHITVSGDLSVLPAYTPLPTPTAAPDFTVTFKNFDTCKGDEFARFVVVNTGSVQFRSAYVKVTNIKNGEVTQQAVNAFDLTVGCVVAKNIAPLGPGMTGYLQSDLFNKDPRGQKLSAVFQLCTEQGLKGTCITKTLIVSGK